MPWESRKGKGRYYTRSRRVEGRLVREYFGCGAEAEQAAAEDDRRKQERQQARRQQAMKRQQRARLEQLIDHYDALVELVFRAEMADRGYHFHRGEWRKHRVSKLQRIASEEQQQQPESTTGSGGEQGADRSARPAGGPGESGRQQRASEPIWGKTSAESLQPGHDFV